MKTLIIDFFELIDKDKEGILGMLSYIEYKMKINKFNLEKQIKVESDVDCNCLKIMQEDD